jgi:uncharacterized membrane protein YkvA (DUF1232 family)
MASRSAYGSTGPRGSTGPGGSASSRGATLPTIIRVLRDGAGPGLAQHLLALPRLVRAARRGEYRRRSPGGVAPLVAAALYVLSPVDLLPELLLPLIGLVDDAVVVTWLVGRLLGETGDFLLWEQTRRDAPGGDVLNGEVVGG